MSFRVRLAVRCALLACAVACAASPAAASVRAGGAPRCTPNGDWPSLKPGVIQSAISMTPGDTLRRIVTIDFDHDGDIDVIAATDRGVRLWLNDGSGNLVVQTPHAAQAVTVSVGIAADPGASQYSTESIQNDLPSFRLLQSYSHAPPDTLRDFALDRSATAIRDALRGLLASRAPPA